MGESVCTHHNRNLAPTIDPLGLHPSACTASRAYEHRHRAVQDSVYKLSARCFTNVRLEVELDRRIDNKRSDITIASFPTEDVLTIVNRSKQYPLITALLLHQKVISCPSPSSHSNNAAPPKSYVIDKPRVELHLDLTFTATGTALEGADMARLLSGDSDCLGDQAATQKIRKYSEHIKSSPASSPRILLPLQFMNDGLPHSITRKFLNLVMTTAANQKSAASSSREFSPLVRFGSNKSPDANKGYLRRELSGLIQQYGAHGMFVVAKNARCFSPHLTGAYDLTMSICRKTCRFHL